MDEQTPEQSGNEFCRLICPKCGYRRRAEDTVPEWQCGGCGVNLDKVLEEEKQRDEQIQAAREAELQAPLMRKRKKLEDDNDEKPYDLGKKPVEVPITLIAGIAIAAIILVFYIVGKLSAPVEPKSAAMKPIEFFTITQCPPCDAVREYLQEKNVVFVEHNLDEDNSGRLMDRFEEESPRKQLPLIIVGSEKVIGTDFGEIDNLINKQRKSNIMLNNLQNNPKFKKIFEGKK